MSEAVYGCHACYHGFHAVASDVCFKAKRKLRPNQTQDDAFHAHAHIPSPLFRNDYDVQEFLSQQQVRDSWNCDVVLTSH